MLGKQWNLLVSFFIGQYRKWSCMSSNVKFSCSQAVMVAAWVIIDITYQYYLS